MGPSSVRRDILNKHREDKKNVGFGKGGRRARRGPRASKDRESQHEESDQGKHTDQEGTIVPNTGLAKSSVSSQTAGGIANTTSDKENDDHHYYQVGSDADDDDEFFDAEDSSLGGFTVTDDTDVLDHDAIH